VATSNFVPSKVRTTAADIRDEPVTVGEAAARKRLNPDYLTAREAADLLRVQRQTLYNWISRGKLTSKHGLRYAGGRLRFERVVLKAAFDRGDLGN
jgi:excisionase family DNA binding protein